MDVETLRKVIAEIMKIEDHEEALKIITRKCPWDIGLAEVPLAGNTCWASDNNCFNCYAAILGLQEAE